MWRCAPFAASPRVSHSIRGCACRHGALYIRKYASHDEQHGGSQPAAQTSAGIGASEASLQSGDSGAIAQQHRLRRESRRASLTTTIIIIMLIIMLIIVIIIILMHPAKAEAVKGARATVEGEVRRLVQACGTPRARQSVGMAALIDSRLPCQHSREEQQTPYIVHRSSYRYHEVHQVGIINSHTANSLHADRQLGSCQLGHPTGRVELGMLTRHQQGCWMKGKRVGRYANINAVHIHGLRNPPKAASCM